MSPDAQSSVAFHTLGCKVNQGETDALAGLFKAGGYRVVPFDQPADVYVINTCTVTHLGDRKSRQAIRRSHRLNPHAVVVVTGCYAQTAPTEVQAIEGVDVIVGTDQRSRIVQLVEEHRMAGSVVNVVDNIMGVRKFEELPGVAEVSRARASLKIQDGCNLFCTYCIIPYARGPVRSRPVESVLIEAQRLVDEGFKEIVLTGIHIGAYGVDIKSDLGQLVASLSKIPGLRRLRIGSVEPQEFSNSLIEAVQLPNVCPHFHIPLQSGSDSVLERMGRRYRRVDFIKIVDKISSLIPNVAITTDVIVGFPGETNDDYQLSEELCRESHLAGMHVFPYSPRKGTPAASFASQIPQKVKEERARRLGALARKLTFGYAKKFVGQTKEVLLEERIEEKVGRSHWIGHTDNYLKVQIPMDSLSPLFADENSVRGSLVPVQLKELQSDATFIGSPV